MSAAETPRVPSWIVVGNHLERLALGKPSPDGFDRTHELYQQTGRKIVVASFANVLVSIGAPLARRLMCDISPCGGGRCFFAVGAKGDLFPCNEFVGVSSLVRTCSTTAFRRFP